MPARSSAPALGHLISLGRNLVCRHALAFALAALVAANAQAAPPPTPAEPVSDTYHGTPVVDPYRWMEDMASPRFQAWLKAQAGYATGVLATLPGRAVLRQRLGELADSSTAVRDIGSAGGRIFYLKRVPGEPGEKLWVRTGLSGPERVLIDPNALPGLRGRHAIDWFNPSPDGRRVAVGLSPGGSEDSTLHLVDVASGRLLGERLPHAGLNQDGVAWLPGGQAFFYNRHPADERYNKSAVYLHRIGQPAAADRPVFGWGIDPARSFELPDLPYLKTSAGSPWVLAEVLHGDAAARSYWVAPRDAVLRGGRADWRRIIGPDDAVTTAVLAGERLWALSQRSASRRELLAIDVRSGERRTALPAGPLVLQHLLATRDAVFVKALDGGVSRLLRVPQAGGAAQPLALPFDGTVREMTSDGRGHLLVRLDGWTRPAEVFRVDARGMFSATALQPRAQVDVSGIEASRVMVRSADGTEVPMSLLSPRGLMRDGRRPTLLSGYGAYGISLEPRFSATRLAWLERGGVQAVCHVRGGGELGDDWHRGGHIETKQNTVSDFIACAQWLIDQKIASPQTLAGTGGSAGGITIGGAITQRPELFAAAHSAVGVSDMLRMELTPNGPPNIAEFGTVTNPAHFKAMFALSPYHRVKDGAAYPGVILTTGVNDPRVDAWMPAKMAARLQAANPGGKPVLLRVDFDAGHGMGSSVGQFLDETADVWAFFLWQMGDPAFQPKVAP